MENRELLLLNKFIDDEGLALELANRYESIIDSYNIKDMYSNKGYAKVSRKRKVYIDKKTGNKYTQNPATFTYPSDSIFSSVKIYYPIVEESWDFLYGVINNHGQETIPVEYEEIDFKKNEWLRVKKNGEWGVVDINNTTIIPCEFDYVSMFCEGLACVRLSNKYGFVKYGGEIQIPCVYEDAQSFNEGVAGVKLNGKWGIINHNGKAVIPFTYDNVSFFSEGLLPVVANDKVGFIDITNRIVIPFEYDIDEYTQLAGLQFSEGLACVGKFVEGSLKFGFINHLNEIIIPFLYDYSNSFKNGFVIMRICKFSTYGRTDVDYLLNDKGESKEIASTFTEIEEENDRFCLNSGTSGNDIMDAFEGDSDALWNVD